MDEQYVCPICRIRFRDAEWLRKHMQERHPIESGELVVRQEYQVESAPTYGQIPPIDEPKLMGQLPSMVKEQLATLPTARQAAFFEEYTRRRKLTVLGYVAWLLLGSHYAYIGGRWGVQLIFWLSWATLVVGAGWWIVDAFRVPQMVRNHNRDVAILVLNDLRQVTAPI